MHILVGIGWRVGTLRLYKIYLFPWLQWLALQQASTNVLPAVISTSLSNFIAKVYQGQNIGQLSEKHQFRHLFCSPHFLSFHVFVLFELSTLACLHSVRNWVDLSGFTKLWNTSSLDAGVSHFNCCTTSVVEGREKAEIMKTPVSFKPSHFGIFGFLFEAKSSRTIQSWWFFNIIFHWFNRSLIFTKTEV